MKLFKSYSVNSVKKELTYYYNSAAVVYFTFPVLSYFDLGEGVKSILFAEYLRVFSHKYPSVQNVDTSATSAGGLWLGGNFLSLDPLVGPPLAGCVLLWVPS